MPCLLVLLACTSAPTTAPLPPTEDPTWSEGDRTCVASWRTTTASLDALHADAARETPRWPTADAALALCRELAVEASLAACLDGAWYAAHPETCAAGFAARPDVRPRWHALFEEVL